MMRDGRDYRLDLTICVGRSLFSGDDLEVLERILSSHLGPWFTGLHAWQDDEGRRELASGFADSVRHIAAEKGDLYRQLTETYGPGSYERRAGSVELRGNDSSLIVVIELDDYVFAPSAGRYLWGNTITFQFCRRDSCNKEAFELSRDILKDCCREMNVYYAHGYLLEEWACKNMSRSGGVMAIGVDVSRYLPGLYWLNYFGQPYCALIGKDRLLGAPACEVSLLGSGVLMQVDERPELWESDDTRHDKVLRHIGDQFFFLRDKPSRQTCAPAYGLRELPRIARFT